MTHSIVTLPGDGIGPEILASATRLLDAVGSFEYDEHAFGGASIDADGAPLTDATVSACKTSGAVLLAAVGGPRWDSTDPSAPRPEQGLLRLRKALGLYANLRPVRPLPALYDASPLKRELIEGTDMLVVRELTGGIYFGAKERTAERASDLCEYSATEIERIARTAFEAARSRVTSVDKMNVLEHQLVDSAAMKLVAAPRHFDVILTENMFGDILSDEAAMLTGSLGMLPSASLGDDGPGLFEPVHGSAPDIAGTGTANPLATFLSVGLMLRYGLDRSGDADRIESAVDAVLER